MACFGLYLPTGQYNCITVLSPRGICVSVALGYLGKELTSSISDIIQQVWNDHAVSFMVPSKAHDSLNIC